MKEKLKEMLTIVLSHELTGTNEDEMVEILQSNYTQDEISFVLAYLYKALGIIKAAN